MLTKTGGWYKHEDWLGWSKDDGKDYWNGHKAGPPWREELKSPVTQQAKKAPKAWSYKQIAKAVELNDPELLRALHIIRKHATTHSRARLLAQLAFGDLD